MTIFEILTVSIVINICILAIVIAFVSNYYDKKIQALMNHTDDVKAVTDEITKKFNQHMDRYHL